MTRWSSQHFRVEAERAGIDSGVIANALVTAKVLHSVSPHLPPIFSLKHLANLTGNEYVRLRSIVRRDEQEPYRLFRLRKKPSFQGDHRFRIIAIPQPSLMRTQRWIAQEILAQLRPHTAAVAYVKHGRVKNAAAVHCQSKWLIKLDITNFFESIDERAVYRVFRDAGYQALVAFELARICTRLGGRTSSKAGGRWYSRRDLGAKISAYRVYRHGGGPSVGHLPQGAPTSPMLANLAVKGLDTDLEALADRYGLRFTRYADDITFSTREKLLDATRQRILAEAFNILRRHGFSPNKAKTRVAGPGDRKVVLGLLVDGPDPCLSRDFRANLRRHLHYLLREDVGPTKHARARGFTSTIGLRNHLLGLLSYARQVDEVYAARCRADFDRIIWPV